LPGLAPPSAPQCAGARSGEIQNHRQNGNLDGRAGYRQGVCCFPGRQAKKPTILCDRRQDDEYLNQKANDGYYRRGCFASVPAGDESQNQSNHFWRAPPKPHRIVTAPSTAGGVKRSMPPIVVVSAGRFRLKICCPVKGDPTGTYVAPFDDFGARSNPLSAGAGSRTRTRDPLITNQVLYQLSYAGLSHSSATETTN
jgi:hypothetical protein